VSIGTISAALPYFGVRENSFRETIASDSDYTYACGDDVGDAPNARMLDDNTRRIKTYDAVSYFSFGPSLEKSIRAPWRDCRAPESR